MANEEQLKILQQGVSAWNAWRAEHPEEVIDLSEAKLSKVTLHVRADLSRADLSGAVLVNADLRQANLTNASLVGADLSGANLGGAVLVNADLSHTCLINVDLSRADLSRADLRQADLREAHLSNVDLFMADLSRAALFNADLREANLRQAKLFNADLTVADLRGAALTVAHLSGAKLSGARLSETDFRYTYLSEVDFRQADLREADLSGADLRLANLVKVNLDRATLTDACLWETQRAGWSIQGIICEAVYWDKDRKERTLYSPGEFERLYADKTKIVLHYKGGISPIEIASLPALIQRIEAIHPGCILRLQSVQEAPGGATVTLIVEEGGKRNLQELAKLKKELEVTGKRLLGFQRKLLEEESTRKWAEEEIARRDKVFARLFLEQEERKLLSPTDARTQALTVMFLDLGGFSKLSEEDRQSKVDMLRSLGVALLPHWNGQYINTWGDAIVAGFEKPNDGLFLACKFIQHLAVEKIEARIGMNRGMVVVQYNPLTERMDIAGDSINVGARLEPMAHSGEVLVSEELRYHPDVQEEHFMFTRHQRPLKKAVGDQQQGGVVECYSVKLREDAK